MVKENKTKTHGAILYYFRASFERNLSKLSKISNFKKNSEKPLILPKKMI